MYLKVHFGLCPGSKALDVFCFACFYLVEKIGILYF